MATITVLESDIIGLDFDCAPVRAHTIKLSEVHINGNDWLELTVDEHNEILSKIGGREERSGAEPGATIAARPRADTAANRARPVRVRRRPGGDGRGPKAL